MFKYIDIDKRKQGCLHDVDVLDELLSKRNFIVINDNTKERGSVYLNPIINDISIRK